MVKKILSGILIGGLLIQILIVSAFAADVTLTLSSGSGYAGNKITISGTCASNEWITIKAVDLSGDIVYIEPVMSENDGTFSTDFIVPDIDAGTITLIAGSGSDIVTANFTVKVYYSDNMINTQEAKITSSVGESITGIVEKTDSGYNITINGDDFSALSGGLVEIASQNIKVTFDQAAADYISDTAGSGSIVLSIVNADKSALSDEAQELIGDRPAYQFTLSAGGTDLSSFGGGFAYVSIPYTPADDEDINKIVIYYISDDGELIAMTNSVYDGTSINAMFSTSHFSTYAVGYNDVTFSDVTVGAWYYDAVTFCAAREITTGTGNDLFSPDATLTRGQFIVMLMRAYDIDPDEAINDNFDDAGDTYYTGYLAAAKQLGISNGVGENMFVPELEITRQDMFTLLYRALDLLEELPEADGSTSLSDFSDADDTSDYAETAMDTFVVAGIISGSDGKLDPTGTSTRAQMTQVLYNLLSL